MNLDAILTSPALASMRARDQWIAWTLVPGNPKPRKLPLNPRTGFGASSTDPNTWADVHTAVAAARNGGPTVGVGYVFAGDHWFIDLDSCLQPDGSWSPLAQQLVAQVLPGAAVEVSQSGRGLHLFGRGVLPPEHRNKNAEHHAELYRTERFVALTGDALQGDSSTDHTAGISWVAQTYFPPRPAGAADLTDGPRPEWRGPADDDELLRRAMQSKSDASRFGGGRASFADLFHADTEVLARSYPPDSNSAEPFDRSSADAGLFQHLAFWSGCDQPRMLRLAKRSKLVREKWDREDYVERTITNACRMQREVLQDKPPPTSPLLPPPAAAVPAIAPGGATVAPAAPAATMMAREGQTFLGAEHQAQLFQGCIYIADQHRVLVPGGRLYKPEQFRAVFGGHSFVMDNQNARVSRNAFEALTESQVLRAPIVDGTAFRPDLPYGTILENEGRRRANVWWPANVRRVAGDPAPILNHIARLFPHERDRNVLLYYMAGVVQFMGHKFQWMPLLIGVEGNGKSVFSRCLAYAVGQRYTHWPAANKLGKQFNAWLFGKVFFAIEDMNIGDALEVWEAIKPMITGENIEVEGKGVDQRTDEICGNFLANSNHRTAVRGTANDRRIAHLWCAQQEVAHLIRDGIDERYTAGLYNWLKREDGFAIFAEHLHTLVIPPEYRLDWLMGRAPRTTSTADAIEAGRGRLEQEILEAVASDTTGFRGGFISSFYLDQLLDRLGKAGAVPPNRRREVLRGLGYDLHPALGADGRTHNVVMPDGIKPRLYVKDGHAILACNVGGEIARAYATAQGVAGR